MNTHQTTPRTISLTVNGAMKRLPQGTTVEELLQEMDMDPEQSGIAVAVNESVVRRSDWDTTSLDEDARVEVITATQGG